MLFDIPHVIFMICSAAVITALLVLAAKLLKTQKQKDRFLFAFSLLTVILHVSSIYVSFFQTGTPKIEHSILFPIYPCNIAMWLVLIASTMKKEGIAFKLVSEFAFYMGVIGGVVGIAFNEIYSGNPNLADWDVLKGMLSHGTMLVACIYLLVGGYVKIRVHNLVSIFCGLLLMVADGGLMILLYTLAGETPPNAMFLLSPPLAAMPWLNTWLLGLFAFLLAAAFCFLFELIALPKEERFVTKRKQYLQRRKDL